MPSIAALSPYGFKEVESGSVERDVEGSSGSESVHRYRCNNNYKLLCRAILENQVSFFDYFNQIATLNFILICSNVLISVKINNESCKQKRFDLQTEFTFLRGSAKTGT